MSLINNILVQKIYMPYFVSCHVGKCVHIWSKKPCLLAMPIAKVSLFDEPILSYGGYDLKYWVEHNDQYLLFPLWEMEMKIQMKPSVQCFLAFLGGQNVTDMWFGKTRHIWKHATNTHPRRHMKM